MAQYTALTTAEDIEWLRSTHVPTLPLDIKYVVLEGNEDSPSKVEGWKDQMPDYFTPPDFVWVDEEIN